MTGHSAPTLARTVSWILWIAFLIGLALFVARWWHPYANVRPWIWIPDDAVLPSIDLPPPPIGADALRGRQALERPLFSMSRRPPQPVAAVAPEPPPVQAPVLPPPELVGWAQTASGMIVILQVEGRTLRLRPGQVVEGWLLVDLQPPTARLQHQSGRIFEVSRPLPRFAPLSEAIETPQ